jgi:hypothetical protein
MEVLTMALYMLLGLGNGASMAWQTIKQAGVQREFNDILRKITSSTEFINAAIPALEAKNASLVADMIGSSPFGSRVAALRKQLDATKQELESKRNQVRENNKQYADASNELQAQMLETQGTGSVITDALRTPIGGEIERLRKDANQAYKVTKATRERIKREKSKPFVPNNNIFGSKAIQNDPRLSRKE